MLSSHLSRLHCPNVPLKEKLENLWPCDAAAEDGRLLQLCDLACGHDVAMLQWSGHTGPGLHRSACRNGTSWPIGALQCSDQSILTVNWPQHSGPTVSHILCLQRTLHPEDCCQAEMSRQSSVCSLNIFSLISPFTTIGEEEDIWWMIVFWCCRNKDFQTNKLFWQFSMSSF